MALPGNARTSQLVPITAGQLSPGDLFVILDSSIPQSKQLSLQELENYLITNELSGTLVGTASYAIIAQSASYVANIVSSSYSLTASFALNGGGGGGSTISSSWASQSLSSSYSATASVVGTALTSNTASLALFSNFANTSSYVNYSGINNGTIFNAINATIAATATTAITAGTSSISNFAFSSNLATSASWATTSLNSNTASLALFAQTASIGITTNFQSSASWASQSLSSSFSSVANSANRAATASYVLPSVVPSLQYGIFPAITQSNYKSQLDVVAINPILQTSVTASIEAMGTVVAPYTSSIPLNESITLYAIGRQTGILYNLDSTPIYVNMQGQVSSVTGSISGSISRGNFTGSYLSGSGGSQSTGSLSGSFSGSFTGSLSGSVSLLLSGSIKFPVSLMGQHILPSGSYMLFLSASTNNIFIDPIRTSKFSVATNVGQFSISSGELMQLTTTNANDLITFSSSGGGPFTDTAAHILVTGSANILLIDLSNITQGIRYIWTLTSLQTIQYNGNLNINDVGGMPGSIVTMSLQNGGLRTLYDLSNTSASILNVSNNLLTSLPNLPTSMSYINCSNNPIMILPSSIPAGVTQFYCINTSISTPPSLLPNSILTMSFANNSGLSSWSTALPTSMTYFDCSGCSQLTSIPAIPPNVLYLNTSGDGLTAAAQDYLCSNLVSNGLSNGTLNIFGNVRPLLGTTITNISILQGRGWTVTS